MCFCSWHENGLYDLAAMIEYALAVTEQPSLFYVGHSMGTTALVALLSERPQYNARIRAAALLAPVAYFSRLRGLLGLALPFGRNLEVSRGIPPYFTGWFRYTVKKLKIYLSRKSAKTRLKNLYISP